MKTAKEISTGINTDNLDRELLKDYVVALKDKDFQALVNKLEIDDNMGKKYTTKFERTVCELKNCSKCKGLENCKNEVEGFVSYPHKEDTRIRFDYVACKYKKQALENEKNKSVTFELTSDVKNARLADIDLTDKKRAHVIKWVKEFYKKYESDKNIKGLFLHGSFGSGKSYILAALLNELAKSGAKATIIYYPKMLRRLKESFNYADEFKMLMEVLETSDLLLIDDIGAETVSAWSRDEILGTILQYRMDSHLPTFLTSNLNIEELEHHLSVTKNGMDIVKAKRIIERIKQLTDDLELISENRRK